MNVLLINGSPANFSHTRALLDYLEIHFSQQGAECETVDLINSVLPINDPVYHADAMQSPDEKVKAFAQKVKDADIIVLGTPLYHGSYSGLLKLALDNLDGDAFAGKIILLSSNASGPRNAMQAAQELVIVGRTMGGRVHESLIGTCKSDFTQTDSGLELTEQSIRKRCQDIVQELS